MPSPLPSVVGAPNSFGAAQAPAQVVASGACAFLNPRLSGTVRAPQEAFDRLRNSSGAARISPPQPIASQTWLGGSVTPAIAQEITIGGRTIQVIRPTDAAAAGRNLPTTAQVAEALRAIPANQLALTNLVIISPQANPVNTPGRTIAGEGGSGEILLFPVYSPQSQNDFDNRMMHEAGHNYQESLWRGGEDVQEWQRAVSADSQPPSHYATEGTGEDFCEFNIIFNTARRTACEATAREIYPNRWQKMLDYQTR